MALTEREISIFNVMIDIANNEVENTQLALLELKSNEKRVVIIGAIEKNGEENIVYPIAKLLEEHEAMRLDFSGIIELN